MASSSSSSAPAVSSQSWSYDVFLSFRGEDTRKTFVDHLYEALVLKRIDTYKDDEKLPRGESIGPSLLKAIEESQIAVIIFSENYADSSWCLDELAHIMICKDTSEQIVMPVFYDVDPSIVRKQKGKYGEAFSKHKLENSNKVESWKKALVNASNISGWETKNIANGHEAKAIKEIVKEISSRLQQVTANANERLTGIASRVHRLKSALQMGSGGVIMIGIWGVGGGGKTTLASSLYDEISRKFDGSCFIENIREESSRPGGLKELEKEILSELGANSVGRGRRLKDKKLCNRKVLVVLDDVNRLDQLEVLAGYADWFGDGSRIIITTRDEHLLKAHGVVVHDIRLLRVDEAIELFHKHAFRGYIPKEEYVQLSKAVVSYAGGLPLALTVLGSSLCDKTIDQWRSALARLKEIPDNKILEKLKVSFDGLTKVQKDLFLDIACFFRRVDKDQVMERLDAFGYHPVIGVEELRQKALITISDHGYFRMHDLVQEMGHYIVRGKHPKNPEKHSRVWKEEDVERLCVMDATMELDKIEAIHVSRHMLDIKFLKRLNLGHEEHPFPPIVANMRNLRYLHWRGDLPNLLHNKFPPRELCCLILHMGIQDHLWNGCKVLPNLKIMELYDLKNLIRTPIFDQIPNLERFKLWRCEKIEEIHSSLGGLDRLICLTVEECLGIKIFPSITRLKKLENLSFKNSPGLIKRSEIEEKMENLLGEKDISPAVWELSKLNHLRLCFFRRDLTKLDLTRCNVGDKDIISSAVWELPNLLQLNLSQNNISRLNFSLIRTPRLKLLEVLGCHYLKELAELPSSIAVIKADFCDKLEAIGDISKCKRLWKVSLFLSERVHPRVCDMFLDSMLKGNAFKDHFMSLVTDYLILGRFLSEYSQGNTFGMRLPHDWYTDFCGFLIHVVSDCGPPEITITMKEEEPDEHLPFEPWDGTNSKALDHDDKPYTSVGYVSFNSLRPTACFNSANTTVIKVSIFTMPSIECINRIGVGLIGRKSKDDPLQTTKVPTDSSEFYHDKDQFGQCDFKVKHDSKSSVTIIWNPYFF